MFKRNYVKNTNQKAKGDSEKVLHIPNNYLKKLTISTWKKKNDIVATIGKLETLANNSNNKKKNLLYVQKRNMKNASWRRMVGCVGKGNKLVSPKTLKMVSF
jgi:hypothetical protein